MYSSTVGAKYSFLTYLDPAGTAGARSPLFRTLLSSLNPCIWDCLPRPPNVPLLRALWSLLDGIWSLLKGSWGVLGIEPVLKLLGFVGSPAGGSSLHLDQIDPRCN